MTFVEQINLIKINSVKVEQILLIIKNWTIQVRGNIKKHTVYLKTLSK